MDNFMDKLAQRYNAQEMIRANSQAETNQMESLREQVEAYEAVLQEMRKLNYKNTELTEKMYSLVDESMEKVRTLKLEASETGNNAELIAAIEDRLANLSVAIDAPGISDDQINTFTSSVEGVSEHVITLNSSVEGVSEQVTTLNSSVEGVSNQVTSLNTSVGAMDAKISNLEYMINEVKGAVEKSASEENTEASRVIAEVDNSELVAAIGTINDKSSEIDTYVKGLWDSVAEIRSEVQSAKSMQDESKDTLKSSLDSAIYGLKQDNREIVEFVQRMNTNLMASVNDPDKEKKEEEALAKEEARKLEMEERFKANEDFMHKESVKVYRNVQAVVNEKMDRHSDSVDLGNKMITAQIAQVKTIAVIAALLSGIDIAVNVLKILGII